MPGPVVWTGDPEAEIARIACCTGSGASFIEAAQAHGADAYVTSDLKYHDADRAPGLGLIGVPHGQIEALMLERWCPELAAALAPDGVAVTVAAPVRTPGSRPPRRHCEARKRSVVCWSPSGCSSVG